MEKIVFAVCLVFALFVCVASRPEEDEVEILYEPYEAKTIAMPEYCKSKKMEFCFNNTNYPTEIVEELLKDLDNLKLAPDEDDESTLFSQRQGSSEESDCLTHSTTDPIYFIVDQSGKDRVVVQMKDKFEQRYSVMWCNKEGSINGRTKHFLEKQVNDFKMACVNRYMHYDFLVLSLKPDILGKYKLERARTQTGIPVCCACRYEKKEED